MEKPEDSQTNYIKPFDQGFVMDLTAVRIKDQIDFSIKLTSERVEDFEPGSDKWMEVFNTLHSLHKFRSIIDDFQKNNPELFERKKVNEH